MQGTLIQIGNSKGVRLPASLIKQYELKDIIEITPAADGILIQPARKRKAREGWEEQINASIEQEGPIDYDADFLALGNEWDEKEWKW